MLKQLYPPSKEEKEVEALRVKRGATNLSRFKKKNTPGRSGATLPERLKLVMGEYRDALRSRASDNAK